MKKILSWIKKSKAGYSLAIALSMIIASVATVMASFIVFVLQDSSGQITVGIIEIIESEFTLGSSDNGKTLTFNGSCSGTASIASLSTSVGAGLTIDSETFNASTFQVVVDVNSAFSPFNLDFGLEGNSAGSVFCSITVVNSGFLTNYNDSWSVVPASTPLDVSFKETGNLVNEAFFGIGGQLEEFSVTGGGGGTVTTAVSNIVGGTVVGSGSGSTPYDASFTITQSSPGTTPVTFRLTLTEPGQTTVFKDFTYNFTNAGAVVTSVTPQTQAHTHTPYQIVVDFTDGNLTSIVSALDVSGNASVLFNSVTGALQVTLDVLATEFGDLSKVIELTDNHGETENVTINATLEDAIPTYTDDSATATINGKLIGEMTLADINDTDSYTYSVTPIDSDVLDQTATTIVSPFSAAGWNFTGTLFNGGGIALDGTAYTVIGTVTDKNLVVLPQTLTTNITGEHGNILTVTVQHGPVSSSNRRQDNLGVKFSHVGLSYDFIDKLSLEYGLTYNSAEKLACEKYEPISDNSYEYGYNESKWENSYLEYGNFSRLFPGTTSKDYVFTGSSEISVNSFSSYYESSWKLSLGLGAGFKFENYDYGSAETTESGDGKNEIGAGFGVKDKWTVSTSPFTEIEKYFEYKEDVDIGDLEGSSSQIKFGNTEGLSRIEATLKF